MTSKGELINYFIVKGSLFLAPMELKKCKLLYVCTRRGNSGGSWDPSSQKIFELAENIRQIARVKL